jgi:hypothetical protein
LDTPSYAFEKLVDTYVQIPEYTSSTGIDDFLRWVGRVTLLGEMKIAYKILVGKPEEKRSPGRPRRKWKGNIRTALWEIG